MKSNEELATDLQNTIEAFLYIVARSAAQKPNNEIVEQFKERIQSIQVAIQNSSDRFLDEEQAKDAIIRLGQDLDSAVQLIQTELQIALVARMDEFRTWRAEIEAPNSGEVVRSLVDVTFKAGGNLKMIVEGTGSVSSTIKNSKFETAKAFNQQTRGVRVVEALENFIVCAEDDIDITTFATG